MMQIRGGTTISLDPPLARLHNCARILYDFMHVCFFYFGSIPYHLLSFDLPHINIFPKQVKCLKDPTIHSKFRLEKMYGLII